MMYQNWINLFSNLSVKEIPHTIQVESTQKSKKTLLKQSSKNQIQRGDQIKPIQNSHKDDITESV